MLSRLFGRRIMVKVRVLGQVDERMVHWEGALRLPATSDLRAALLAAGKAAGVDLLGAIAAGAEPALLHDGARVDLPHGLAEPLADGATVTWLSPMAGG